MTEPSISLEPEALVALRDATLDAALIRWNQRGRTGELLGAMRSEAESLGLADVLDRLDEVGDSCGPAGLVLLAERLLNAEVTFDDALIALRAPVFTDRHRAIAMLYASANPKCRKEGVDMVMLRLVGETADDPELAARAYLRLGDLSSHDANSAAYAYGAGFNKSAETDLPGLQASCLVALAKCALCMKRPADAADNAGLAKQLYERDGDTANAEAAAIVEAVGRLESDDPSGAAAVVRPLVARQREHGIAPGAVDASVILKQSIREAAKPAFEQAQVADAAAVATYDAALALAGDTGYRYPDEAADRTLIGQCLVRGDDRHAGAGQLALAVEIARERGDPETLRKALVARCDWLVHTQSPDALDTATKALKLARAAGDETSLPGILVLHASALRQAKQLDEALAAYAEANALEFRLAYHVGLITALLEAGRVDAALEAVAALIAAIREQKPETLTGDEEHVALLLALLVRHGQPGAAQQLREALESKGGEHGAALGSARRIFITRALETLAHAAAQISAGQHDAGEEALAPLLREAQALGEPLIELTAAYALGENALVAGRYDDALAYLQSVVDKAESALTGHKADALTKLGTAYSLGFKRHDIALDYQERAIALHRERSDWSGLVVSLIQAAQTCVVLDRLDQAEGYAEELRELGPKYPPQDIEWLNFVPALVDAHQHRWDRAKPGYRATIRELERKRAQFSTAAAQRQWCEQKAFMYGSAIEAAIVAGECEEAITYLELARNRYLDGVAREHGVAGRDHAGVARVGLDEDEFLTSRSLEDVIAPDTALVWCGGFPRGFGVVAAWRRDDAIELASGFYPEITGDDLTGLFQGDVSKILAAHRAGRSVELAIEMALSERDLNFGANPYWQAHGADWNRSIAEVIETVSRDLWPKILATVGNAVSNMVLLPSVGCSELPLSAAAPARWPDGTLLTVSTAPGIDMLPSLTQTSTRTSPRLVQVVNPSEDPALLCCPIEESAVRALFDNSTATLHGRRASTKRVAEAMAHAGVFHFMGHAFCDWRDPLDSGLVCARRKDGTSVLTVRELFNLVGAIETPLIVLSACQIGNVQAGDKQNDFINLPAALVAAGARAVIAPRWLVDDVAASMLLANLFERWRRDGTPAGAALAAARRWLRDEVTRADVERWLKPGETAVNANRLCKLQQRYLEAYSSDARPFSDVAHWGAFELTGDPRPFGGHNA